MKERDRVGTVHSEEKEIIIRMVEIEEERA